jgi:DNA-binding NarL/FixJ family response regulator
VNKNRTTVRSREKVVVATNDQATRAGIRMALAADGFRVNAEAGSVEELKAALDREQPDACLLDVDLRGDALRAISVFAATMPSLAVVVLTDDENEAEFLDAMRLGASGYLPKTIAPAALASAVRAVLDGEPAVPRGLVALLINEYRERPARRFLTLQGDREAELTAREWEVLELMSERLSTREIAERLLISEVTVRRHIGAVVKKVDATSRSEALNFLETA